MARKQIAMATIRVRPKLYPTTTARNAYQLLDEVAAAILAEPKRLDMRRWVMPLRWLKQHRSPTTVPMCGTVACVAGWIYSMADPEGLAREARGNAIGDVGSPTIGAIARKLLGQSAFSDYRLASDISEVFNGSELRSDIHGLRVGTLPYARAIVQRIRTFQDRWRDHLLNTPIPAK
jgi:hypothetical protein